MRSKNPLRRWLGISRTRIFTAVVTPCLIGATAAFADSFFPAARFILLIFGLVLAETMNLLLSDWVEYKRIDISKGRAIPPPHLEGNPMFPTKIIPLKYTVYAGFAVAVPSLIILFYFVSNLGWPIWVFLVLAAITGAFYVAPPFRYAFFSTALLPPIIAFGAYFILSGMPGWKAGLSALPILFISSGVIYTYRVLYESKVQGLFEVKRNYLKISYGLCYLTLSVLVISRATTPWILLGMLSLPIYFYIVKLTTIEKSDYMPATSLGVLLHFSTGILISVGYLISAS